MKIAILYASVHHNDTEKVVKAMAEVADVDLFNVTKPCDFKIDGYDIVGFDLSGIRCLHAQGEEKNHQNYL